MFCLRPFPLALALAVALCSVLIVDAAEAQEVSALLSWTAPTMNANGSTPLTDLAGYKVYSGLNPGNYTHYLDVGNVVNKTIGGLQVGVTYYFAVTAYDLSGNESNYSEEKSWTPQTQTPPPPPPPPPTPAPVAAFTGTPTSGPAPLAVTFSDGSSGSITGWSWNFGGGGSSTVQNPSHTYSSPGIYTVSLTVTGPGGSNTATKSNYINVVLPPPVAAFSGTPTSGPAPQTVQFTNTSSGSITGWSWDFGDGGTSTMQHPSHPYSTVGSYTVKLTASGPGGSVTATKNNYISITQPAPQTPVVTFNATPTSGQAPLTVQFSDTTSGSISARNWNFGDGTTGTGAVVSHTYATPGSYPVTLTVSNGQLSGTGTATITVNSNNTPACSFANLARCATASASSIWSSDFSAAQANDGGGSTRWNSASNDTAGAWLMLDFGTSTTFNTIVLKEAISRITSYSLQAWTGSTWQELVPGTTIGATTTHTFTAAKTAQLVRLLVNGTVSAGSTGTPTIWEFEVYNNDTNNGGSPCGSANLARCATASASSAWSASYDAAQASDGSDSTRWNSASGKTAEEWLELDFGALRRFRTIVLKEAYGRITGYSLQFWNGSAWQDIVAGSSIGATKTHTFGAIDAQRVRLKVTSTVSSGDNGTPTIYEFEVYQ